MKIYLNDIKDKNSYFFKEDLNYLIKNESSFIKKIEDIDGEINIKKIVDVYELKLNLSVNLILISAYTFKEFKDNLKINDKLYFTTNKELETEDVFFENDVIDLDSLIYSLILTSLPLNPHKEGEKLESGEDYNVMSEDEYNSLNLTSPFDKLAELDLEE